MTENDEHVGRQVVSLLKLSTSSCTARSQLLPRTVQEQPYSHCIIYNNAYVTHYRQSTSCHWGCPEEATLHMCQHINCLLSYPLEGVSGVCGPGPAGERTGFSPKLLTNLALCSYTCNRSLQVLVLQHTTLYNCIYYVHLTPFIHLH